MSYTYAEKIIKIWFIAKDAGIHFDTRSLNTLISMCLISLYLTWIMIGNLAVGGNERKM